MNNQLKHGLLLLLSTSLFACGGSDGGGVTIIDPPPPPPVDKPIGYDATDAVVTVMQGAAFIGKVYTASNETQTYSVGAAPKHGTISFIAGQPGLFVYQHTGGNLTADEFTFRSETSENMSTEAKVSINVVGKEDKASLVGESFTLQQQESSKVYLTEQ